MKPEIYNWQSPQWPNFTYNLSEIQDLLYQYALEASALSGHVAGLSEEIRLEALIDVMIVEALKSSEIEGEKFNPEDVRSSIRKELGLVDDSAEIKDQSAAGIGKLMVMVQQTFAEPLSQQMLFEWHRLIMAGTHLARRHIGSWRAGKEPMQIVSGGIGRERVHFEAPPSEQVPREMANFISWFNSTSPKKNGAVIPGPVRAAIAHLYFESIHPFDDGNGRIGRAISDKALSQDLRHPVVLSLSSVIQQNKKEYYHELSKASHDDLDITKWIEYFVKSIYQAQLHSKKQIAFVLQKAQFWRIAHGLLNNRQEKVLRKILKAGAQGFADGVSAQKYMAMCSCSKATATRDLSDLLEKKLIVKLESGGRSTRYQIVLPIKGF